MVLVLAVFKPVKLRLQLNAPKRHLLDEPYRNFMSPIIPIALIVAIFAFTIGRASASTRSHRPTHTYRNYRR